MSHGREGQRATGRARGRPARRCRVLRCRRRVEPAGADLRSRPRRARMGRSAERADSRDHVFAGHRIEARGGPRRHGRRVPRDRPRARAAGRAEADRARRRAGPGVPRALRARVPRGRGDRPSARRRGLPRRRGGRRAVRDDALRRGHRPRRAAGGRASRSRPSARSSIVAQVAGRARRGARARPRAPRRQADERADRAARRRRARVPDRLRADQAARGRRRADAARLRDGHGGLHGARAGARRRRRRARRRLRARAACSTSRSRARRRSTASSDLEKMLRAPATTRRRRCSTRGPDLPRGARRGGAARAGQGPRRPAASRRARSRDAALAAIGDGAPRRARAAPPDAMRVVVAEDSVLLRAGVVHLLEAAGFDVVGRGRRRRGAAAPRSASTGPTSRSPTSGCRRRRPTRGCARRARSAPSCPGPGVVVLSQYAEEAYATELLGESAEGVGYLLKDRVADPRGLRRRRAAGRAGRLGARSRRSSRRCSTAAARRARSTRSSTRQRDVLARMAEGQSNGAIARGLDVTERAVERDVSDDLRQARPAGRQRRAPPRARRAHVPAGLTNFNGGIEGRAGQRREPRFHGLATGVDRVCRRQRRYRARVGGAPGVDRRSGPLLDARRTARKDSVVVVAAAPTPAAPAAPAAAVVVVRLGGVVVRAGPGPDESSEPDPAPDASSSGVAVGVRSGRSSSPPRPRPRLSSSSRRGRRSSSPAFSGSAWRPTRCDVRLVAAVVTPTATSRPASASSGPEDDAADGHRGQRRRRAGEGSAKPHAGGSTTSATVPPPSRGRSVTSPPQRRASSRAIGRPRPVPGAPRAPGAAAVEALEDVLLLARARGPARGRAPRSRRPSATISTSRARRRVQRARSRRARRGSGRRRRGAIHAAPSPSRRATQPLAALGGRRLPSARGRAARRSRSVEPLAARRRARRRG